MARPNKNKPTKRSPAKNESLDKKSVTTDSTPHFRFIEFLDNSFLELYYYGHLFHAVMFILASVGFSYSIFIEQTSSVMSVGGFIVFLVGFSLLAEYVLCLVVCMGYELYKAFRSE